MLIRQDPLVHELIGSAIEVHRAIGPGLLESAYARCLEYELTTRGVPFRRDVAVPLRYKTIVIDRAYRADLIIGDTVLVELKSVDVVLPLHHAQVMTYLRLLGLRHGMLINFNVRRLVDGIKNFLL